MQTGDIVTLDLAQRRPGYWVLMQGPFPWWRLRQELMEGLVTGWTASEASLTLVHRPSFTPGMTLKDNQGEMTVVEDLGDFVRCEYQRPRLPMGRTLNGKEVHLSFHQPGVMDLDKGSLVVSNLSLFLG